MTHMLSFDLDSTFRAIVARMQEEGVFTRDAYVDLVEEYLEEKREVGELDEDDDIEQYEDVLEKRWPEAEDALTSSQQNDVLEQE